MSLLTSISGRSREVDLDTQKSEPTQRIAAIADKISELDKKIAEAEADWEAALGSARESFAKAKYDRFAAEKLELLRQQTVLLSQPPARPLSGPPSSTVTPSSLLKEWEFYTIRDPKPLHGWSHLCGEFCKFQRGEKWPHMLRLAITLHLQVRTCCIEPDTETRGDGLPGSYGLQALAMKLVYELISLVELKSVDELRHIHDVPTDPTVVVHTNKRIGSGSLFIPDVALGKVAHEGAVLTPVDVVVYQEIKRSCDTDTHAFLNRLRLGEAQCINHAAITCFDTTSSGSSVVRVTPCLLSDGVSVRGVIISHSRAQEKRSMATCMQLLPLSGPATPQHVDAVRDVDVDSAGFREFVYLIWLGRRLHLDVRASGQQVDVAFRPGDIIKVASNSGDVAMVVLEPLATARARGGIYRVLYQTGPHTGQQSVLKHGGKPCELAQLQHSGVSTANWHQVVRERELHLHLGSNHVRAIPQMQTHGRLAAPLPPGFAALEGAEAVLLAPLGEELGPLPLSPHDVLAIAADVLGALIELIDQQAFHNEVHPRHVLLQPLLQGGRRQYMLIDYGGAACPRLADPAIEAQLCLHNQEVAPMLALRPCVQDLLCGSLQSLLGSWGRLLSQGSDLQSLVFTVVLLAGGHLPWEDAAEAGDLAAASNLRMQLFQQSSEAQCLHCLPPLLAEFAAWVLDTANLPVVNLEEVRAWHRVLLKAVESGTHRQDTDVVSSAVDFGCRAVEVW